MTISFLLIIMILLAFFATLINDEEFALPEVCENIRDQDVSQDFSAEIVGDCIEELVDQVKSLEARLAQASRENEDLREELGQLKNEQLPIANRLETYMSQSTEQRREFLDKLREGLLVEFPELQVVVSPEQDALRFQGEGLFRSGSSRLEPRQREIVETLGRLLDETLVCFTLGERAERGPDCKSGNALIEAVQIEGHTDSDGTDLNNLRLSTERANATLLVMLDEDRSILEHQNLRGQPVMSVSGYGEMRPIEKNDTIERKAANRRIDLRIIMYAPSKVMDVEEVERRLDALRDAGEAQ
ncbi:OmpA/MotB family protein [Jannaschia seohaensis]|nr:OmpA family protein [Jannaschia seohaensis]